MSIGKAILGLAAAGAAGLTLWKVAETVGEARVLGAPVWWSIWRRPLPPDAPNLDPAFGQHVTRVFWLERKTGQRPSWTAITKFVQQTVPEKYLAKTPPTPGSIYAQVTWKHDLKRKKWFVTGVEYASAPNLPPGGLR